MRANISHRADFNAEKNALFQSLAGEFEKHSGELGIVNERAENLHTVANGKDRNGIACMRAGGPTESLVVIKHAVDFGSQFIVRSVKRFFVLLIEVAAYGGIVESANTAFLTLGGFYLIPQACVFGSETLDHFP